MVLPLGPHTTTTRHMPCKARPKYLVYILTELTILVAVWLPVVFSLVPLLVNLGIFVMTPPLGTKVPDALFGDNILFLITNITFFKTLFWHTILNQIVFGSGMDPR